MEPTTGKNDFIVSAIESESIDGGRKLDWLLSLLRRSVTPANPTAVPPLN